MFIAHLPAGYILAKYLEKRISPHYLTKKAFFSAVLIGAVFPDIDLFYFYLIDNRSVHHHKYFLHWFSFWIPIFVIALSAFKFSLFKQSITLFLSLFAGAALLHICLDTFVGDVWLFAPFIDRAYVFFEVTNRYQPWWLNFIFHWSFGVELLICAYSYMLYTRRKEVRVNKSIS